MKLDKIFVKNACPTSTGGQAVLEGIMMKSSKADAVAVRVPDGRIHIRTQKRTKSGGMAAIPLLRGVYIFMASLIQGMTILTYSADVLEAYGGLEETKEEQDVFSRWMERRFGKEKSWNIMIGFSVLLAIVFSVLIFVIGPTVLINLLKVITTNEIILNVAEGILRITLFIGYIWIISKMPDIQRLFQYHGAEHKTIHCFENGLPLTPENCQKFYTLHPRCGTSFLMFVMIIALVLFSLLGWPNLLWRIASRILLIPVIAGLSYELLRWAGRSDGLLVKILSVPGLLLQKMTTAQPDLQQLEVAIAAMKAVTAEEISEGEGICDENGIVVEPRTIGGKEKEGKQG